MSDPIVLRNANVEVLLGSEHGEILRIHHRRLGIDLVRERRLAENFRLLVPLPERRGHYIRGASQPLVGVEVSGDGSGAVLEWGALTSSAGRFDIRVRMSVRLSADDVSFRAEIENHTDLTVEEVLAPSIGGLDGREDDAAHWRLHHANWVGVGHEWPIYEQFPGSYLGPPEPVWQAMYPRDMSMPWVDIYHARRRVGVTLADLNPAPAGAMSMFFAQLSPATSYRGDRQWWPTAQEAGATPVGLTLGWSRFPFVAPGSTWESPPVALRFHDGTWWEAARAYRRWFDATMPYPVDKRGGWLSRQDAWQSTIMSYPEGTITTRFTDIPRLAAAAKSAGIHVLQLDGWDIGGIDRDYPYYRPDPRLGTPEELRAAITVSQEMGVHVLLFANLQWASLETDWYRNELHRYASKDPRGLARNSMGWEYQTSLGLAGQCEMRMVVMDPSKEGFNRIIKDELDNVSGLGADGMQLDKLGAGFSINYDTDPAFGPADAVPSGVWDVLRWLHERKRAGFALATEAHWDRVMPFADASYSRFFSEEHLPTTAAAFPEYRQTNCIVGPYDRSMVNNCVRYGHIINIEGRYLHGSADDMPELGPYVRSVLELRRRLTSVIWDSELREPEDSGWQVDGDEALRWSVHQSREDPDAGAVVLNHFGRATKSAAVAADDGTSEGLLWRPGQAPEPVRFPAKVDVGPDEVVVATWGL